MGRPKKWTEEHISYLKEIAEGKTYKEITKLMSDKFSYPFKIADVGNLIHRNNIKTGRKSGKPPKDVNSTGYRSDSYEVIKTEQGNWQYKHRYIYEKHYGKIKKGNCVIFLDGNRENFNIENLKEVTKEQNVIMNKYKLYCSDADLTNTGIQVANLIIKTGKLKRNIADR